jgi:formate hydrogenlyase subunit 6/NADH:ubiquinone oxidoreductase subunit I
MNARRVLPTRAGVDALRRSLARDRVLYEVRAAGGEPDWQPASPDVPFDFDAPLALAGAKRFFFPPRETLLRWHGDDVAAVEPETRPVVLFGLRACDLAAIAYQDRFFATDHRYVRRRGAALLVGLNCPVACAGGFCVEVGAGPFSRTGYDLNLSLLPDGRVLVEVGSQAGLEALARADTAAEPADAVTDAAFERFVGVVVASFPARPLVRRAIRRIERHEVAEAEWRALGPACFECTGCTNLCPTCSCFTVVDQPSGGGGERARVWDSCLLEGFQREASGHHPAPLPADRVRRFWTHKLSADFAGFDRPGCVGCGRCDVTCPGSIGALRVLAALGAR